MDSSEARHFHDEPQTLELQLLLAGLWHADRGTQVQGVPLDGMTATDASDEAEQKKCQYVLYTRLLELRTATDPYQHVPGTIETNPNSQWSSQNARTQAVDPEFRVTVEYKLYRVGNSSAVAGAPYSTQLAMNEIDAVSQVMDRIATRVADEIKKGGPPPRSASSLALRHPDWRAMAETGIPCWNFAASSVRC
jgi:hypothetical protein